MGHGGASPSSPPPHTHTPCWLVHHLGPKPLMMPKTRSSKTDLQQKCPPLWLTALLSRAFSRPWGQHVYPPLVIGHKYLEDWKGEPPQTPDTNVGHSCGWVGREGQGKSHLHGWQSRKLRRKWASWSHWATEPPILEPADYPTSGLLIV